MTHDEAETVEVGDTVIVGRQSVTVVSIRRTPGAQQEDFVPYFVLNRKVTACGWRSAVASFRICEKGGTA